MLLKNMSDYFTKKNYYYYGWVQYSINIDIIYSFKGDNTLSLIASLSSVLHHLYFVISL